MTENVRKSDMIVRLGGEIRFEQRVTDVQLEDDPAGAMARATARFQALARDRGEAPHVRLTAAFSDGQRLYALRYASDDQAPTLFHRWSENRNGRAVVSEPLESDEADWIEVPAQSFCVFEGARVAIAPFQPDLLRAAA